MPIYEYECEKCLLRFEEKRRFGEDGGACCPECHSEARRIFSPVSIIFKGSGFYVTDYAAQKGPQPGNRRGNGDKPADTDKSTNVAKESKDEVAS